VFATCSSRTFCSSSSIINSPHLASPCPSTLSVSLVCARVSLCLGFVYFVYGVVVSLFGIPEVIQSAAYLLPASLLLFTIFHSFYTLGWRCFLAFVPLTLVLSWAFEELGANTVFPYGGLKYSSMLPGRIGSVPVEVPFSYLMVLYPALCLADLLLNGDCWKRHTQLDASAWTVRGWLHDFFRTVLTALLMCGWLVVADPTAVSWCGLWTYTGTESAGGSVLFFGVPAQVVVSWFFVFFVIIFIYLRTESWIKVGAPSTQREQKKKRSRRRRRRRKKDAREHVVLKKYYLTACLTVGVCWFVSREIACTHPVHVCHCAFHTDALFHAAHRYDPLVPLRQEKRSGHCSPGYCSHWCRYPFCCHRACV